VVFFKIQTGDGLSFKKKNWNFAQWQMMMVALRRVYMSQSAEPFRIDSSQSAQFFSRNSSRFQPVGSAMSNRFRKN
jgi:hypothetical protein